MSLSTLVNNAARWAGVASLALLALSPLNPSDAYAQHKGRRVAQADPPTIGNILIGDHVYTGNEQNPVNIGAGTYTVTTAENTDSDPSNNDYIAVIRLTDDDLKLVREPSIVRLWARQYVLPNNSTRVSTDFNINQHYLVLACDSRADFSDPSFDIKSLVVTTNLPLTRMGIKDDTRPVGDFIVGSSTLYEKDLEEGLDLREGTYPVRTTQHDDTVLVVPLEQLWNKLRGQPETGPGHGYELSEPEEILSHLSDTTLLGVVYAHYLAGQEQPAAPELVVRPDGTYVLFAFDNQSPEQSPRATYVRGISDVSEVTPSPTPTPTPTPSLIAEPSATPVLPEPIPLLPKQRAYTLDVTAGLVYLLEREIVGSTNGNVPIVISDEGRHNGGGIGFVGGGEFQLLDPFEASLDIDGYYSGSSELSRWGIRVNPMYRFNKDTVTIDAGGYYSFDSERFDEGNLSSTRSFHTARAMARADWHFAVPLKQGEYSQDLYSVDDLKKGVSTLVIGLKTMLAAGPTRLTDNGTTFEWDLTGFEASVHPRIQYDQMGASVSIDYRRSQFAHPNHTIGEIVSRFGWGPNVWYKLSDTLMVNGSIRRQESVVEGADHTGTTRLLYRSENTFGATLSYRIH